MTYFLNWVILTLLVLAFLCLEQADGSSFISGRSLLQLFMLNLKES